MKNEKLFKFNNQEHTSMNIQIKEILNVTFIDYLSKGLNLNLIYSIDFTASNGVPTSKGSLHYFDRDNFYQNMNQ